MTTILITVQVNIPDGATHYAGKLEDPDCEFYKHSHIGKPCDCWCVYNRSNDTWFVRHNGPEQPWYVKELPFTGAQLTKKGGETMKQSRKHQKALLLECITRANDEHRHADAAELLSLYNSIRV